VGALMNRLYHASAGTTWQGGRILKEEYQQLLKQSKEFSMWIENICWECKAREHYPGNEDTPAHSWCPAELLPVSGKCIRNGELIETSALLDMAVELMNRDDV
jgi:hypothetical protein